MAGEITKTAGANDIVARQKAVISNLTAMYDHSTKLAAEAAAMAEELNQELAKTTGDTVQKAVENATETPGAVSDELKDSLVDTISKIDPGLASDLTEEFAKIEMADEKVDGEKLGRAILKVFDKLNASRVYYNGGRTTPKPSDKQASRQTGAAPAGNFGKKLADELDQLTGGRR